MIFQIINDIKLAIIKFNNDRTMPDDLQYFNEAYWSECSIERLIKGYISLPESNRKYKWQEYKQSKYGVWFKTDVSMFTNTDYRSNK
tara:strand:- start:19009 stop:19269 length:261 start_codon:yes stop_codon:yes gene_type:complete